MLLRVTQSTIATRHAPVRRSDQSRLAPAALVWLVLLLCCGLPMLWLVVQLLTHPAALGELRLDAFRVRLLVRTLLYNFWAAVAAVMLAVPAALVLGRGRGFFATALWFVLPVSLLMPSL